MAKKKGFIKSIFGNKFTMADAVLLIILVGFPIFYYQNIQNGLMIINEGLSESIKQFGSYVWFAIIGFYVLTGLKERAKK